MSEPPTLARHLALHTVAIAGIGLLALGLAGCSQEPDQPQRLAELRAEAEAGDAGSLWMLGSRYQFVDDAEAVTWCRMMSRGWWRGLSRWRRGMDGMGIGGSRGCCGGRAGG